VSFRGHSYPTKVWHPCSSYILKYRSINDLCRIYALVDVGRKGNLAAPWHGF